VSRTTLRDGVVSWLTGQVQGINTVYPSLPALIPGSAFFAEGVYGAQTGCVALVDLISDKEKRIATGGAHSGWKRVDYVIAIQLFFRSTAPAPLGQDRGILAMEAFDLIVENLKQRIRADRTANGSVWQWGEGTGEGTPDLEGSYGEIVERGDAIELWAAIQTQVTEMTQT
jgi:hypothetical protein